MNRDSRIFTARKQVVGETQVLAGPWPLDGIKDWKHKFSLMVYNRGNVDHLGYNMFFVPQYLVNGVWTNCPQPNALGSALIEIKANAERMVEFYFPKGEAFRYIGYAVGGDTEGAVDTIEMDFESNISDR